MEEIGPGIFVSTAFRQVNVGAVLTGDGWVLIDTPPYPDDARRWRAQLFQRSKAPVRYVIYTDHHRDRVIGGFWFDGYVAAHRYTADAMRSLPAQFIDQSIDALARNDMERVTFAGVKLRMPDISFNKRMYLKHGGYTIPLVSMPGPTPGSAWVHFPDERIVFAGDSVVLNTHPFMAHAASKAWLDSLTTLRRARFAADVVVPGRGPLTDKEATNPMSEYIRTARRRVYNLYRLGRPRADTASLLPEFVEMFPVGENDSYEEIQRRVKSGLDHIYEEYKAAEAARSQEQKK
ncbi:MAG: MBL fold metallo-hydrolase [Anaerolineae bacterium]|nr:MBL fold metallo-hydrolase [Anaerolineae bacterium]